MKKAYKLELKSGNYIEIHLNKTECELTIDDIPSFLININGQDIKITKLPKSKEDVLSFEEIEYISFMDAVEPLRKCIDCNGRRYCITNGCANTPCGSICD